MKVYSFDVECFDSVKPKIVFESEFTKEICISMQKNSVMKEHKAPAAIIVQVLKGQIDFEVEGKSYDMKEFDAITLEANKPHSLTAKENSIVRLSLSKKDSFSRVKTVEIG
ncbi:MAG: cupin domain-containing protein [Campylobacter sp.]|nr:cupin domain-containing protein [Campylobacter sp.]